MITNVAARARKRRSALRAVGLRRVQIWVPDSRRPGFAAEFQRQSMLASQADLADLDLLAFMDKALTDLNGWAA